MLAGNLAGIGVSAIISLSTSYIWPENYDFALTRTIGQENKNVAPEKAEVAEIATSSASSIQGVPDDEKKTVDINVISPAFASASSSIAPEKEEMDIEGLQKAYTLAVRASIALFLILIILVSFSCSTFLAIVQAQILFLLLIDSTSIVLFVLRVFKDWIYCLRESRVLLSLVFLNKMQCSCDYKFIRLPFALSGYSQVQAL